ncbi:MAG TPA: hypothetical protein VMU83_18970 [Hanamia sp.]|nr:hypothetical protein [Hanamia sp.]
MKDEAINIKDLKVSAYTIPTDAPESDGTIEWESTTMVIVEINTGEKAGIGYCYADISSAFFIENGLKNKYT